MTVEASDFRRLEAAIDEAMPGDRQRLRGVLRSVRRAARAGKPYDRNLARLTADLERSVGVRKARRGGVPGVRFDDELPIAARREEIARAIGEHQVVVVSGDTGSGKSTQLPKICLELGRGVDGMIGHTQPRRIAARSVAARIAEELSVPLGREVGFKIRFTDATSPQTYVKLMTDGILLAESQHDRFLSQYDTLIIDEAHERSLNIDFLIGYVKRLLPKRPDLKLIITSATIDVERFSEHFATAAGPAPVIEVSGRMYPVEVRYRPIGDADPVGRTSKSVRQIVAGTLRVPGPHTERADDSSDGLGSPSHGEKADGLGSPSYGGGGGDIDWLRGVLNAVDEAAAIDAGDMLVFLPTERDILETARALRSRRLPGDYPGRTTEILPLYGRLPTGDQDRVFRPHPHRRIVLATNVAESSLTVPGIRFVIDTGTARLSRYSARSKVQRLPIEPISQASADQRKGRCGRVGPGVCIRLYGEQDYLARDRYTAPEIQRTNLASVILQTKALDLGPIEEFPFIDPPKPAAIRDGYQTLFELGAIDERNELTELGRQLSRLPADPRIARMVLAAQEENCLSEVLIIASALEVQDPRERPIDKQQAADERHARFADADSDFVGYLKLWDFFHGLKQELSKSRVRKTCHENFLSYNRLREWADVHRQLMELVEQWSVVSGQWPEGRDQRSEVSGQKASGGRQPPGGRRRQEAGGSRQGQKAGGRESERVAPAGHAKRDSGSPPLQGGAGGGKAGGSARSTPPGPPLVRGGEKSALRGGEKSALSAEKLSVEKYAAIHRALLAGLLSNVAFRGETHEYMGAGGNKFHLWPGAGAFKKKPKWIVAAELVETGRRYLRTAARIDPGWIEPLAGHLIKKTYSEPHWDRNSGTVRAFEKVTLFGLTIVPRRSVRYGPIDPVKSRELFIQHALVEGEFDTKAPFFEHNRKLLEELEALQAKTRRHGLVPGEEVRYEFYDRRVPAPQPVGRTSKSVQQSSDGLGSPSYEGMGDVYDGPSFEKWRKQAERSEPKLLFMQKSDLIGDEADDSTEAEFPSALSVNTMRLPLEYHLQPGTDEDGITLTVPKEGLNQLDPQRLGWLVPGLLEQKIVALIKSLPKHIRRNFVPVPDTARDVLRQIRFGEGNFTAAVAAVLSRIAGEPISPDAFQPETLPSHLRMNVRVVDDKGRPLAAGRDVGQLQQQLGAEASASFAQADDPRWTRDGLTDWTFGDLPPQIDVVRGGVAMKGFPMLVDRGESVSLRLSDTPEKAALQTRRGLRRLFLLTAKRDLKTQVEWLPKLNQVLLYATTLEGGATQFKRQLGELVADRAFFPDDTFPRTEAAFRERVKLGRNRISVAVQDVAKLIVPLMESYHQARLAVERATAPAWQYAVEDINGQVAHLTEGDFLTNTQWGWLHQFPRYFQVIRHRLDKLAVGGLAHDQRLHRQIAPRWQACLDRLRRHREQGVYDPQLVHYRWLLEEYRVSLFAQKLRTAVPVSEKRLDEQWSRVRL